MKKSAATKRRSFRIESLESRSMLAADGLILDSGSHIDQELGPPRVLGTVDVRVADSVMTFDVFAARGFRSVPSSDARPDWHGRPSGSGGDANVLRPQYTFIALPELQDRLAMIAQASNGAPVGLQFDWSDSLWSGSTSIESPGSKPLPVHVDPPAGPGGGSADDMLSDLTAGSEGERGPESGDQGPHLGADASILAATSTPQADVETSDSETAARIDRAILELADESVAESDMGEANPADRDGVTLEAAAWSSAFKQHLAPLTAGQLLFADGMRKLDANIAADLIANLRSDLQQERVWNAGSDRNGDFLDGWIVQNSDLEQQLSQLARSEMIDLNTDFSNDLVGTAYSYGGLKMTQLFVAADGDVGSEGVAEAPTQLAIVFDSLATHHRLASAVGVIAVASCLALRQRSEQPLGMVPKR
ncbi:hypothetical protein [Rosistilla oblonga]|nr:hypothetical protein [Rosistilla oblonga]